MTMPLVTWGADGAFDSGKSGYIAGDFEVRGNIYGAFGAPTTVFQSNSPNTATYLAAVPTGVNKNAGFVAHNTSDQSGGYARLRVDTNAATLDTSGLTLVMSPSSNMIEQRNGTNPQATYFYNTYTNDSNYERGYFRWQFGIFELGSEWAGSGQAHAVRLSANGGGDLIFSNNYADRWRIEWQTGNLLPWDDAAYDLGSTTKRIKTIYTSGNVNASGNIVAGSVFADSVRGNAGSLLVGPSSNTTLILQTNSTYRWIINQSGHFIAGADATYDIGASGANRPRDLYLSSTAWTSSVRSTAGLTVRADGNLFIHVGTDNKIGFLTNGTERWDVDNNGHFIARTDNFYDIGLSGSSRPRDIYAARNVNVAGQVLAADGAPTSASHGFSNFPGAGMFYLGSGASIGVSIYSPSARLMLDARTDIALSGNAWFNNGNWNSWDNTAASAHHLVGQGSFAWYTGAATTGSISWVAQMSLNTSGLSVTGSIFTNTIVSNTFNIYNTGAMYFHGPTGSTWANLYVGDVFVGSSARLYWDGSQYLRSNQAFYADATIVTGGTIDNGGSVYYFGHNSGIWVQYHSSGYIWASHTFLTAGTGIFFNSSAAYGMYWNGGGFRFTHYVMTDGDLYYYGPSGSYYTQRASTNILQCVNMNLLSWGWVGFAGNAGVYITWDGTYIKGNQHMYGPHITTGGQLNLLDSNVRWERAGNRPHSYSWDALWGFFRTSDSYSCGYIDTGGWHNPSTLKGKKDIRELGDGLSLICDRRVRPLRFTHFGAQGLDDLPAVPDKPSMGFAAEEMEELIPEVVGHDPDTGEANGINYGALVAVLWDAVRTLNARIEVLEKA